MSEHVQHEIEDLWWLRHCLESLTESKDINSTIRVGLLRSVLETTRPEPSTTDPRRPTSPTQDADQVTHDLCFDRYPNNYGITCSRPRGHASPHAMGHDGATWPTTDEGTTHD